MTGQQLKNSILQMAVQGKLVPQDPNDEPASVLLERIRAEKEQLIKEGKIKKEKNPSVIFRGADNLPYEKVGKNEPVCIADEVPFDIPESWEWVRLGEIFQHNTGKALNSSNKSGVLLEYITTSNLYWDRFELENLRSMYFTENEIEKCQVSKGDLLVCEGGDIGRAAIWLKDYKICIQNHIHRLRSYVPLCTRFYYYVFFLYKYAGWIGGKGIGIQGLSSNALHSLLVPVPPIAEQERIVKRLEIIKPLSDKYSEASEQIQELNNLFPEHLKKSILQYAVQGKLVPQDPADEPASVLLERIRTEKEQLVKEGKIKRDKMESVIFKGDDNSYYEKIGDSVACIDAELPFEIPDNWCWARLNCISINYDSYRKPINSYDRKNRVLGKSKDELYPYYGATGQIGFIDDFLFNGEYILLGEDAAPFLDKKAQKAYMIKGKSWVNNHAHILQSLVFPEYLTNCLNSIDYFDYVYGTTRLKLTQENMNRILVPVPSIEEQCKIAQAINNLFVLIESIKASLS